jgi:hypothetical protein
MNRLFLNSPGSRLPSAVSLTLAHSRRIRGAQTFLRLGLFVLIIAVVLSASVARAGDVKIQVVMSTGPDDDPTTTFAVDTPKIFALFKTKGVQDGDKLRGVWIAEDVGDAAPKETKIDENTLKAEGDTDDGAFSLSKPTKGWPVGKYRLEIYVGDELAKTVKFTIKGSS